MSNIETARLRRLLSYDPETGALTWRPRSRRDCVSEGEMRRWNTSFAGCKAGSIKKRKDGGLRHHVVLDNRSFIASRLIWQLVTGEIPPCLIDHKDGDPTNGRWNNLRLANISQNAANQKISRVNTSGFKGVVWMNGRWRAQIQGTKHQHLGMFDDPAEAHAAYMDAARKAYGEFARAS